MKILLFRLLAMGVLFLAVADANAQSPFVFSCGEDSHIDSAELKAIDSSAVEFWQRFLGPEPGIAFDLLSKDAKSKVSQEQLRAQAAGVQPYQLKNVTVQHTYQISLKGQSPGRVVCATDLTKPDGWESLAAASIPEQAHVLLFADAINNQFALTAWLIPEQSTWKVQGYWLNVATLADKNPFQLWGLAREQQGRGHKFNASLLYAAAAQTANRGPNFQMGLAQAITRSASSLEVPSEINAAPPFSWRSSTATFRVLNVGPIAVGGKIYVIIVQEVSPWKTDAEVDGRNKQLLSFFKARFPEYSDVFSGLVARAVEHGGNRGYGTVDDLTKGGPSPAR